MSLVLPKIPFLLEFFINGIFILLYSVKTTKELHPFWEKFGSIEQVELIVQHGVKVVPFVLLGVLLTNFFRSKSIDYFFRKHIFSLVVVVPLLITFGDFQFTFSLASVHLLASILSAYDDDYLDDASERDFQKVDLLTRIKLRPAQLVLLSFLGVIFLGTFLLMLPIASASGVSFGFIDSLFMATSATCVTGLSTISIGSQYTPFGQIVILILIQIGGLSIMTLYASMTILLGKFMGIKRRLLMQDLLDVSSMEELFQMIISIIKYTFIIELWGGIVLTFAFTFEGIEFGQAIYYGFFHSISAFCNAGFSLFDTGLESYATTPLIHGTIAILIALGGLGFIVLKELKAIIVKRESFVRLGTHSKTVLITSFLLTFSGTLLFFFGEFLSSLDGYTLWEKMQISFFQSVTLRTAGFNTIPLRDLNSYTIYMMTLFMFIGGSPGSTAGGVKTTTLAILIQSIRATLKVEKNVNLFDRKISLPIVVRVIALTFISILTVCIFILVMMKFEPEQNFLSLFFEVVSASGTVGLSLGITPYLSVAGKIAISILMLIGRIGPLTLILAIGEKEQSSGSFNYPDGRIMIG